jgi:hypothetical protein
MRCDAMRCDAMKDDEPEDDAMKDDEDVEAGAEAGTEHVDIAADAGPKYVEIDAEEGTEADNLLPVDDEAADSVLGSIGEFARDKTMPQDDDDGDATMAEPSPAKSNNTGVKIMCNILDAPFGLQSDQETITETEDEVESLPAPSASKSASGVHDAAKFGGRAQAGTIYRYGSLRRQTHRADGDATMAEPSPAKSDNTGVKAKRNVLDIPFGLQSEDQF